MTSKKTKEYVESVEKKNIELQTIIDDLGEDIIKSESKMDHLLKAFNDYYDNYHGMKTFIEDLASHGVRFDVKPTMCDIDIDDFAIISNFYDYIERIDSSIRDRASEIKDLVDKTEKENGL